MISPIARFVAVALVAFTAGCGGGGGGDRAPGVEPGPPPSGGPVPPPPTPTPPAPGTIDAGSIDADDEVTVEVTNVAVSSPPTVTFELTVNGSLSVTGLTTSNVRFSLAELIPETNFDIESWTPFIDAPEDPVCRTQADVNANDCTTFTTETDPALIPESALEVQDPVAIGKVETDHGTTETTGTLSDNGDGTWSYTYDADIGDPSTVANMVRSCMQFSLNAPTDNACVDFIPQDLVNPGIGLMATSLTPGFYAAYRSRQVVHQDTCNTCHADLALHGGGRTATDYCVTCHNPTSVDAQSSNPVDFKVMIHRIHYARNLDSVVGGTAYKIWGFRNGEHDYSNVSYPQKVINCTRCHAGQEDVDNAMADGLPAPEAVITEDGYNWASKPNPVTCLGCHESAEGHVAGRDSCVQCHGPGEFASVEDKHRDVLEEKGLALNLSIDAVTQTAATQNPIITFSATRDGTPIDVLNAAEFDGDIRIRIGWDAATEYLNSGGNQPPIAVNLSNAVSIGGNQFQIDTDGLSGTPIPAGIDTLGINGYLNENVAEGLASATSPDVYVESSAMSPTPRRRVVDKAACNDCHRRLTFHAPGGRSVTDNPQVCVGCHEPNRASGGSSTSTDYSVLIHGLHASGFREAPYRGWDAERLQFPGDLADCVTCHINGTQQVPLPLDRVPVLVDPPTVTGLYTTPVAAACGACHDSAVSTAHMESAGGAVIGGDFDDADAAVESCDVCHRSGAIADVDVVHAR